MNPQFSDDAVEARILGNWTCQAGGDLCEYSFQPKNHFSCAVTRRSEPPFNVHGFWCVLEQNLHIGTSLQDSEPARLILRDHDHFSTALTSGQEMHFRRISRAE